MSKLYWILQIILMACLMAIVPHSALAAPLAHEAPPGSEWIMADWMFLSFIIIGGAAFLAFILALKAGLLSNLEDAKYYILEIEEKDFYSNDWADKEGGDA